MECKIRFNAVKVNIALLQKRSAIAEYRKLDAIVAASQHQARSGGGSGKPLVLSLAFLQEMAAVFLDVGDYSSALKVAGTAHELCREPQPGSEDFIPSARCAFEAASVVARCAAAGVSIDNDNGDGRSSSGSSSGSSAPSQTDGSRRKHWDTAVAHFDAIEKMQLAVFTAHQRALLSEKPESTVAKVIRDAVTSKAYLKLGGINHWASARSAELMAEAAAAAAASAAAAADAGAGVEKAGARGERRLKRVNSLQAYRAREDFNAKDGQWNGQ